MADYVTGSVTGTVTGSVTGTITGIVIDSVTGIVTGTATGTITGIEAGGGAGDVPEALGRHDASLPLDLLPYCEIGHLVALARRHGLSPSLVAEHFHLRPVRNATPEQEAMYCALHERVDETIRYLLDTRPHPQPFGAVRPAAFTAAAVSVARADADAWRVAQMPRATLVALIENTVNTQLSQLGYKLLHCQPPPAPSLPDAPPPPPLPPHRAAASPPRPPTRTRSRAQSDRVVS